MPLDSTYSLDGPRLVGARRRGPRLAAATLGLVAALALARLRSGIEGGPLCVGDDAALLVASDDVGWTFAPGLTAQVRSCTGGFATPLRINAEGQADQPWPATPRADEVRVLVLGNETADGLMVAREDRLSTRIALLADRTLGRRVAGINATLPGYATAQQRRWLEARGPRFTPALVVVLVDPEADLAATVSPPRARPAPADGEDLLPPASGLVDLAGHGPLRDDDTAARSTAVRIERPAPLVSPAERKPARAQLAREITSLARAAAAQDARLAILIAPPCPLAETAPDDDLCAALAGIAPCADLTPAFAEHAAAVATTELCVPGTRRWGRDAHFLASHAVWDLLDARGLWPAGVVRGHRL